MSNLRGCSFQSNGFCIGLVWNPYWNLPLTNRYVSPEKTSPRSIILMVYDDNSNVISHPGRLTWNLMMVWMIIFLFNWVIFWFHVNLPGCMIISKTVKEKSISRSILVAGHYIGIPVGYMFFFLNCF